MIIGRLTYLVHIILWWQCHFCSCFACFIYLWPSFSCSQLPTSWDCVRVWDWQEVWEQSTVRLQLLCSSGRGHQCRRYCVHNMRFREMVQDELTLLFVCIHMYALDVLNVYTARKASFFYWILNCTPLHLIRSYDRPCSHWEGAPKDWV